MFGFEMSLLILKGTGVTGKHIIFCAQNDTQNGINCILRISYKTKIGKDDLNWVWQRELLSSATRAQSSVDCRVTYEKCQYKIALNHS
jgi:hypothetical protein